MMKALGYGVILGLVSAFNGHLGADENTAEKPEYAWEYDAKRGDIYGGSKYVYGSIDLPDNFLRNLYGPSDTEEKDDPFSSTGKNSSHSYSLDKAAPLAKPSDTPRCLPPNRSYRDPSVLLAAQGVNIEKPGWVFYSQSATGTDQLHFCANWTHADVISCICCALHASEPRNALLCMTLVSIPNPGLKNIAWTAEKILQASPVIHARLGNISRSGEQCISTFISPDGKISNTAKYTITLGDDDQTFNCRLNFSSPLPPNNNLNIHQNTEFAGRFGTPFTIDCGSAGKDSRNYFLLVDVQRQPAQAHSHYHDLYRIIQKLDKIDGIHTIAKEAKQPHKKNALHSIKFITQSYQSPSSLLETLHQLPPIHATLKPPLRVPANQHPKLFATTDKVFDLTPQLKRLNVKLNKEEWVYHNSTHDYVIIHATAYAHTSILSMLKQLTTSPKLARINAQLISVDVKGMEKPRWSYEKIKKRQPIHISTHSTTSRSGVATQSGSLKKQKIIDLKTNESAPIKRIIFETESTINLDKSIIDCRLNLDIPSSQKLPYSIHLSTAATVKDGKSTFIELGHPSNEGRTHLLILNADIITPDGSFYRDRFTPIKN